MALIARRWADELAAAGAPAVRAALSARERAAGALRDVQALRYVSDPAGPVDEVETDVRRVLEQGADCEERAMLLAALCAAAGVPAEVVWIVQRGAPLDHVTARVDVGAGWEWADPTIPGARVGEHPRDAARRVGYRPHARGVS